jgi:hypothetical protein
MDTPLLIASSRFIAVSPSLVIGMSGFHSSFIPPCATEREEARTNYHAGPGGGTSRRYLLGGLFLTPSY